MAARSASSPTRPPRARRAESRPLPIRWPVPKGCGQVYVDKVHERDLATPETAHLFGSAEPRICTPPLRELTPETSLGFEVIDFAYEVLGITLLPWQRVALIRMLELNEDGSLRFRTVVVLVARQNGKSTLAQVLTIWLLFVWGWPLVLGTAQDLDIAETLWSEVVDMVHEDDELTALVDGVTKTNGKKSLNLRSGAKYKVKAANRRAGRGLSGNLILLDELREHQTWDAWGAITKTTMARAEALILALSNAGDVTSRVLKYLRLMAHRACGDPDGIAALEDAETTGPTQYDVDELDAELLDDDEDEFDDDLEFELDDLEQDEDTLCLLEWSAPPGCDRADRAGWSWANPARRYTITDRSINAARKTDTEWVFRTEVLCQWPDGATSGPFDPGGWADGTIEIVVDAEGRARAKYPDVDTIVGSVVAGLAQSNDRGLAWIAIAGHRPDGARQVEVIPARPGNEWVAGWLSSPERKRPIKAVAGQARGAAETPLLKKLHADRKLKVPVVDIAGGDLLDAYAELDDAIRDRDVWHTPHPALDLAAETAEKKILAGGGWVLDPVKSPSDIAALRACVHALWLLEHLPEPAPPPPPAAATISREDLDDDLGRGPNFADIRF